MANVHSNSWQGVQSAWRNLNQSAHKIAAGTVNARRASVPGAAASNPDRGKAKASDDTVKVDIAEELTKARQAKIDASANLRVMETERELERDTLDILA
jgi:hypothetical protein